MYEEFVSVAAWSLFLAFVGVWGITFILRFFVLKKDGQFALYGRLFVRSDDLTEQGRRLWRVRNFLLVVIGLLVPILWSLKLPS
jgi:hypothetical protein